MNKWGTSGVAFSGPFLAKKYTPRNTTNVCACASLCLAGGPFVRFSGALGLILAVGFLGLFSQAAIAAVRDDQGAARQATSTEEHFPRLITELRRKAGNCDGDGSTNLSESGKDPSTAPTATGDLEVTVRFTRADGTVVKWNCDFEE